jgi:hypothetical protein
MYHLYELLEKNIMPWQWDFQSYTGTPEKVAMVGFFYPEDIENIKQIERYKITGHNRSVKQK